ncbi:ABC transporter ATP-binding protein [Ruania halotolerans]|uniref:ABC transporter ATP-binding protein n=1 Tax=Ruania halotolerans TaxID=2897773 RepID=UPI001E5F69CD|nr:ABC transporter ATP-binding protein [Ruania halotolerans]UFU06346.1 ABC transporter ATP-binding protein/permease [Ruania halotolerans]
MHDFPPEVPEYPTRQAGATTTGQIGDASDRVTRELPDTRSPSRFLLWLLRRQAYAMVGMFLTGILVFLPGAAGPYFVGRAVDEGIVAGSWDGLLTWSLILLGVIAVAASVGVLMHTYAVHGWVSALYRTTKLVTRKTTQMGHVLPQRIPTGEILSVSSSDSDKYGALSEVMGRAMAALFAYLVVVGLVLSTSVPLGLITLVAAPVLVFVAAPLLRPLHRRQAVERSRASELTSLATDIVAGLRILRGIGGERTFGANYAKQSQLVRHAGVSAGIWQAAVEAVGTLFSGLFLVTLTWFGTRLVAQDELTVGQLISFFGYAVFMVVPIYTFFELVQKWVQSLVSARKTITLLEQEPPWEEPATPAPLPADAPIHDELTGFTARPGVLTVVVSAVPDDTAALADRLGRYLVSAAEPVSTELEEGVKGKRARQTRAEREAARRAQAEKDREKARRRWGVTVGGVDLSQASLAEVRERILVSDTASMVFGGTLQQALDPHGRLTRAEAEQAMYVASADDVFEALPNGWQGHLDERGRGLSGGQRQRLVLARAVAADPDIAVFVEPTSAVDAHTEARIAERLSAHRRGRTTVIASVSPLLLHHADRVAFLSDGRLAAEGTHEELLATNADYRRVVVRSMEDDPLDDDPPPMPPPNLDGPDGPEGTAARVGSDAPGDRLDDPAEPAGAPAGVPTHSHPGTLGPHPEEARHD